MMGYLTQKWGSPWFQGINWLERHKRCIEGCLFLLRIPGEEFLIEQRPHYTAGGFFLSPSALAAMRPPATNSNHERSKARDFEEGSL